MTTPSPIVEQALQHAAAVTGVPYAVLSAVAWVESRYNPKALSSAGAEGLMQLMPATQETFGVTDPYDPVQNALAGAKFLAELARRYGGDWSRAFAAYNWGPGHVDAHPSETSWPGEVQSYVAMVASKAGINRSSGSVGAVLLALLGVAGFLFTVTKLWLRGPR